MTLPDTVYRAYAHTAAQWPDNPFLCVMPETAGIYGIEAGETLYRPFLERVDALKARYEQAGYGHGHRAGLLLENRPAFFLHWFALNALYAAVVWGLYGYDLHLVRQREGDFDSPPERALLADIFHDQRVNIVFMMPAAVLFQAFAWWLVHEFPETMLVHRWHLLLIALTLLFSLNYLYGGVSILRRRQEWIVERNAHALAGD